MAKFEQFEDGWGINLCDEYGRGIPMKVSDIPQLMQALNEVESGLFRPLEEIEKDLDS